MICDPNHSKIKEFLAVILGFSIKIIFLWNLFVFFVLINDFSTESTNNSRERREVSLSRPAASERLRGADLQLQLATAASPVLAVMAGCVTHYDTAKSSTVFF